MIIFLLILKHVAVSSWGLKLLDILRRFRENDANDKNALWWCCTNKERDIPLEWKQCFFSLHPVSSFSRYERKEDLIFATNIQGLKYTTYVRKKSKTASKPLTYLRLVREYNEKQQRHCRNSNRKRTSVCYSHILFSFF